MSRDGKCPIWNSTAQIEDPDGRDGTVVNSARAGGRYFITGTASAMVSSWSTEKKVTLTSSMVRERQMGIDCPTITSDTLHGVEKILFASVLDRADSLLRFVHKRSKLLGDVTAFSVDDKFRDQKKVDELLAYTGSQKLSEVVTLVEYCWKKEWLDHKVPEVGGVLIDSVHEIMLKPQGYVRLDELNGINQTSSQAFVAMWFDDTMVSAYQDGIEPAIRETGYVPLRIDKKEHIQKIDDQIIAEIRRSRFVVADFTSETGKPRGGVYYETGFAMGLNIPVIWTCREDRISEVHFDTRQFNHIVWKEPKDLKTKLAVRISAVLGDGPHKKKTPTR